MKGAGFYNRHSSLQAAGIELALPLLEQAARTLSADGTAPLVIADYGSSQGRNSMRPMGLAIAALRQRFGPDRAIEVVHTDLPANDFTSLFMTLKDDQTSYLAGQPRVFPSAIGRSYFEPILPPGRVHLGWNSWTLHWLSGDAVQVPDHAFGVFSGVANARERIRAQQASDWTDFLAARSAEMADGAKVVSLSMGATPRIHGWDWIFGELWQAALHMAHEGLISAKELTRFTIPVAGRTVADIEAPFAGGRFAGLSLEHVEVVEAPDPFWDRFCETGDTGQFAKSWAGMMQAVCGPLATAAFASQPNGAALADQVFRRLEARIAASPQRHQHFLAIAVVFKTGDG